MKNLSVGFVLCLIAAMPISAAGGEPVSLVKSERVYGFGNDIRSVLILDDGLLAATGGGLKRYRVSKRGYALERTYSLKNGLPSNNCYRLKKDGKGGVWAAFDRGLAYLPHRGVRWRSFTMKDGLPSDIINDLAISADGRRVWASTPKGLATARVSDRKWRAFPRKDVGGIFVHPAKIAVWCQIVVPSPCICGSSVLISAFDLKTGKWSDVPDTRDCPHVAIHAVHFSPETGLLWLLKDPPRFYDASTRKTKTWPRELHWERQSGNTVEYSEWFGDMAPAKGAGGNMWFATTAGLWLYDVKAKSWQMHSAYKKDRSGNSLLAVSSDGNRIAWACEDVLAVYDHVKKKWTRLWTDPDDDVVKRRLSPIMLSFTPDDKHLWCMGAKQVIVCDLQSAKSKVLTDADVFGLSKARRVHFDANRKLSLINTPDGLICTSFGGKVLKKLRNSNSPATGQITRFVFAPDGKEVFCLQKGRNSLYGAAVLNVEKGQWRVPEPVRRGERAKAVAYSKDGKHCWLSTDGAGGPGCLHERIKGAPGWKRLKGDWLKISDIQQIIPTRDGKYVWCASFGCGICRIDISTGDVKGLRRSVWGTPRDDELIENYVTDLLFTPDGKLAVCNASGGGRNGLSVINLKTMKVRSYRTPIDNSANAGMDIAKAVLSPDGKSVWCIYGNGGLLNFDLTKRTWPKILRAEKDTPFMYFRTLAPLPPDGSAVWIRSDEGLAVYWRNRNKWRIFKDAGWRQNIWTPPLCVSSDKKRIICGHRSGVAIIQADGSSHEVLSVAKKVEDCTVSHILPTGKADMYVCAIRHPQAGGVYMVNTKAKTLRLLKNITGTSVTALAMGPGGHVWIATNAGVVVLTLGETL